MRIPAWQQSISETNPIDTPIRLPSAEAIAKLRQTRREIAEFNRELAEIEAQLDRELYEQKMVRMGKIDQSATDSKRMFGNTDMGYLFIPKLVEIPLNPP